MRENVADAVKSTAPQPLELGEQCLGFGYGVDLSLDELLAAAPRQVDESSLLKDRHVLLHRSGAHWIQAGQPGDRQSSVHRPADDVSPGAVRQRPKDEINVPLLNVSAIYNHMVVR